MTEETSNIIPEQFLIRGEDDLNRASSRGPVPPGAINNIPPGMAMELPLPELLRARSRSRSSGGGIPSLSMMQTAQATSLAGVAEPPLFDDTLNFNNVVKIFVTSQGPDYGNPWMTVGITNSTGSGVVIETAGGLRILTAAHVVNACTFLQVQRSGIQNPNKYTAKVFAICHDSDLALLSVEEDDGTFWKGLRPAKISGIPALRSVVLVAGFPVGGEQISITEGVVSRIEGQTYFHSNRSLLALTVDAAINSGNSGGPVFNVDGELVGVAFQVQQFGVMSSGNGHVVPPPVLHHFLDGIAKAGPQDYQGIPYPGIEAQELTNRNLRNYFNLDKSVQGVLVTKVVYDSCCDGVVQVHDVLTHIDGNPVANNETVVYEGCGRVKLHILFQMKQCGDTVSLDVIRKGKKMTLQVIAKPEQTLVARSAHDRWPTYFVYCGLVFQRLSIRFVDRQTPGFCHYERLIDNDILMSKDWRQVVILSKVLSDEVNVGYENDRLEQIKKFNGENVPDFASLVEKIEKAEPPYFCLETCCGEQIILPSPGTPEAIEANKRIMSHYHISADRRMGATEST